MKFIILIFFTLPSLAYADVYQYIDEEGITHLSDSPSNESYALILKSEHPALDSNLSNVIPSAAEAENPILNRSKLLGLITESAQKNQIDSELIHAVIHVESASNRKAVSQKGAQGLMQLIPATANRFGVSNAFDAAQNIEGGAKYLRELLNLFNNDLSLALAAYNAGENAVIKYGYRIPPYKETQQYVPKVLQTYKALLKQRKQEI